MPFFNIMIWYLHFALFYLTSFLSAWPSVSIGLNLYLLPCFSSFLQSSAPSWSAAILHRKCQWRLQIGFFSNKLPLEVPRLCVLIPCELVKMTSLAFREVGVGLLNDKRWKLTVWSHTAPGKPTLHSALWEQWAGSSKELKGTTLWLMFPENKETWEMQSLVGSRDVAALTWLLKLIKAVLWWCLTWLHCFFIIYVSFVLWNKIKTINK